MKPRSSPQHLPQQGSLLPLEAPDPLALATAAALRGHDGHYSELHGELMRAAARPQKLSPLWQHFFRANGATGWTDLAARAARIQARVREDGATYNVYGGPHEEGGQSARVWPLELLPMIVDAGEWAAIERGVTQRARLLDGVMADIYGERRLLDEGLLPASLVFGHPQYLRAMHGCKPLGGVHLHVVAFELLRGGDGLWWVVGQRTQAPSGLGYLLENRLIVAEQFPEAFRDLSVQRLAAAFQASVQGLMRLSPAGERARVALLTPGPRNETYFEHAFLARYLGVTLVEGGDLTVRGDKLFLKTTLGLERVDVLMRRVDDEYLDPLELRPDSILGVPGLLQAMRAGNVVVANAPGAGWLESPGLSAFWPGVSKALLGEELLLPGTTSWWCGEEAAWAAHRDNLKDFVVAPTFPGGAAASFKPQLAGALSPSARAELAVSIQNDPSAYTLQARLKPAETPVWRDGLLEPRPYVLRVFAISDGRGGYSVMPGGLTRVAQRHDGPTDPWLSMQSGSASVDTWVLTEGEVDPTSLLPPPLSAAELSTAHWTVTSRSAENLFWLGRYTERAENCVRLARVTLETLAGDRRGSSSPELLRALDALTRRCGLVGEGVPSAEQSQRLFERALVHALVDTREASSVAWNLRALQSCAQSLRERLSAEQWTLIQDSGEQFSQQLGALLAHSQAVPLSAVLGVLGRADTHLAAITGGQTDRMTRDDGWRLLSVGRQIERLDFLCNVLVECFEHGLHQRDAGFATMLALFDSTITYRAQFQGRREVLALLQLLVHDTDNPRSLAWVARTMRERFVKLSRIDQEWAAEVAASLPKPDEWPLDAIGTPDAQGRFARLNELLGDASEQALTLSVQIGRQFFSHVGRVDRMVWQ